MIPLDAPHEVKASCQIRKRSVIHDFFVVTPTYIERIKNISSIVIKLVSILVLAQHMISRDTDGEWNS